MPKRVLILSFCLMVGLLALSGHRSVMATETSGDHLSAPAYLFALPQGQDSSGKWRIYLGWRLDPLKKDVRYNVYRSPDGTDYERINDSLIKKSTNYLDDSDIEAGTTYYYFVKAVDPETGAESGNSNVVEVTAGEWTNIYRKIDFILPNPAVGRAKTGDIDGDGLPDFLVVCRTTASYVPLEELEDDEREDLEGHGNVHIKVYYNDGRLACDIDMGETEQLPLFPWSLWDVNDDGKEELIGVMRDHVVNDYYLYVMDPNYSATPGYRVLAKVPVPSSNYSWEPKTIKYKNIAFAHLDGHRPYILFASGHQLSQRRYVRAYTYDNHPQLTIRWEYYEAPNVGISSCHQFEVADIDRDGKDEAFMGTYVFDKHGLWQDRWGGHEWSHPDGVAVDFIKPGLNGDNNQEVYMYLEQTPGGIHVTDWKGKEIHKWEDIDDCPYTRHAHAGWIADVVDRTAGMEVWVYYKWTGMGMVCPFLYDCDGNKFEIIGDNLHFGYGPVDWDGHGPLEVNCIPDIERLVADPHDKTILYLKPIQPPQNIGGVKFTMDLIGDYREEIFTIVRDKTGYLYMEVYTNTQLNSRRKSSPCENRQYLQKHRWAGH